VGSRSCCVVNYASWSGYTTLSLQTDQYHLHTTSPHSAMPKPRVSTQVEKCFTVQPWASNTPEGDRPNAVNADVQFAPLVQEDCGSTPAASTSQPTSVMFEPLVQREENLIGSNAQTFWPATSSQPTAPCPIPSPWMTAIRAVGLPHSSHQQEEAPRVSPEDPEASDSGAEDEGLEEQANSSVGPSLRGVCQLALIPGPGGGCSGHVVDSSSLVCYGVSGRDVSASADAME
jgi:hypothetical protein